MKTVNFLTSHFLPENTAGTNRVLSYVKELEKKYKVNVVCLTERGKYEKEERVHYSDNIDIYYVNQKDYDTEKFFSRALWEMKFTMNLVKRAKLIPSDVTIATSPFMFIIPVLALSHKQSKKIIDIRDITWEYIDANSKFKKLLKGAIARLMQSSIDMYDFVCVTNTFEQNWVNTNTQNRNMKQISNGIEIQKFQELSQIEINKDIPFTITYIGNIAIGQNVKVLVDGAKNLPGVQVNIVGEGTLYRTLKEYVELNKITNIKFFGKVDRSEIVNFYQNSTVLYAQLDEHFKTAMPSKLYEYASTGLPIIYGGIGEAVKFVNRLENSVTIPPNNPNILRETILSFKDTAFSISQKNRRFVENNFIREIESAKLVDIVDELINLKEEK